MTFALFDLTVPASLRPMRRATESSKWLVRESPLADGTKAANS
jgi:hypothetical protein